MEKIPEHILRMPKIDLHCHLDGSLPLNTVKRLVGNDKLKQSDLEAEKNCGSLKTYLEKFDLPLAGMQTESGLRTAARDFMVSLQEDHMVYVEVRFAPMLSVWEGLSCRKVLEAVLDGMKEGERMTGIRWQVISCAMRHHMPEQNQMMLETAREYLGQGICAVDLAGDEASCPVKSFRTLFEEAKRLEMPFTIHAGECGSAANVQDAITMGAARIGHGIAMRQREEVMREAARKKIGVELCPTSNYQTKAVGPGESYPLAEFWKHGIRVTVNTDNRTVSGTTMAAELAIGEEMFRRAGLAAEADAEKLLENAIAVSFLKEEEKDRIYRRVKGIDK